MLISFRIRSILETHFEDKLEPVKKPSALDVKMNFSEAHLEKIPLNFLKNLPKCRYLADLAAFFPFS